MTNHRLAIVLAERLRKEHPDWTWQRIALEAARMATGSNK